MDTDSRFTDGRVPGSHLRELLKEEHRWQRWLDVESALAQAEAEAGIIPAAAARAISDHAVLEELGVDEIRAGIRRTSHPLMAMVSRFSEVVGEPHGGWVHWGATTRNITQTGDALVLKEVHQVLLGLVGENLEAMAALAEKGRSMVCAGRTHGQQAVPITFGFKVAGWIDEFARHVDRLREVETRVFTAMMGGAVGNYASFGHKGPQVQAGVARLLGLEPLAVPSRANTDFLAEYVCILGMMASTTSKISKEIYILMSAEFHEAFEPIPEGTIGSSTMPQKRNPQLADDCIALAAQIRSLVPLALEGMMHDHEVSGANESMMDSAVLRSCLLTGDMLTRLVVILQGLELDPVSMRENLELTHGLIMSEAVMLALGESIGRQRAHEIVYEAAQQATVGDQSFMDELLVFPEVKKHLGQPKVKHLLDPATHVGLSVEISKDAARRARALSQQINTKKAASAAVSG
jgi:3-carboxy-cis,cis-muconate cycloisomerase